MTILFNIKKAVKKAKVLGEQLVDLLIEVDVDGKYYAPMSARENVATVYDFNEFKQLRKQEDDKILTQVTKTLVLANKVAEQNKTTVKYITNWNEFQRATEMDIMTDEDGQRGIRQSAILTYSSDKRAEVIFGEHEKRNGEFIYSRASMGFREKEMYVVVKKNTTFEFQGPKQVDIQREIICYVPSMYMTKIG